jgi:hypothetical protein
MQDTGEIKHSGQMLVVKPKERDHLRRYWQRWDNNIKTELREINYESVDWIHLAQTRGQ